MSESSPEFLDKTGRIAEVAPAEELAHLEKPARDRELNLKKEAEEGLTAEQKKNIEIMDGVEQKYPHAFKTIQDESGKVLWGIRPGGGSIIFGKEGVFRIYGETMPEGLRDDLIDEKKLAELVNDPKSDKYTGIYHWRNINRDGVSESRHFEKTYLLKEGVNSESDKHFSLGKLNLTTEAGQEKVRESLTRAEKLGKEKKEREAAVEVSTEEILTGL